MIMQYVTQYVVGGDHIFISSIGDKFKAVY